MAHTTSLVSTVTTASGCCKNPFWRTSASNRHKTKQWGRQGSQANKAVRPTRQSGQHGSQANKAVRPTKQWGRLGSQANKAVRPTRQSGQQGSQAIKAVRPTRQSGQQGSQANKAVRPTRQLDLPALFRARYYCLLFWVDFVPTNSPWAIYFY